jgi:preprotein translocase subunit YajC
MLTLAFAQGPEAAVAAPQAGSNPIMGLLPIFVIFIIFYFLLIRPQKKQQKQHAEMITELKKNDEIVTTGGLFGTIVNVEKQNDVMTVRIDENTKVKIQKASVARLKKPKTE